MLRTVRSNDYWKGGKMKYIILLAIILCGCGESKDMITQTEYDGDFPQPQCPMIWAAGTPMYENLVYMDAQGNEYRLCEFAEVKF